MSAPERLSRAIPDGGVLRQVPLEAFTTAVETIRRAGASRIAAELAVEALVKAGWRPGFEGAEERALCRKKWACCGAPCAREAEHAGGCKCAVELKDEESR